MSNKPPSWNTPALSGLEVTKWGRWACILALTIALLSATPSQAGVGIGIHGGMDLLTVDAQELMVFTLIDSSNVSLTREKISNPYHYGVHIFIDDIPAPIIDELDVSLDFASTTYRFDFENTNYSLTESQIEPEEVKFSRIGVAVTIRHWLLSVPSKFETFRMYAGVGFGMQMMSPVVCRDLIYDNLFDSTYPLNLEDQDILKKSSRASFVGLAGFRIKPPQLPISFRGECRYNIMRNWEYEQPENFLSLSIGLSYYN